MPHDRFTPGPEFDFHPRTRVLFGNGRLDRLGDLTKDHGGNRILICTDRGIRATGQVDRAVAVLREAGLTVTVFDEIPTDPTTRDIEAGTDAARRAGADLLIGLGGGSSLDCAKGINFLLTNGGSLVDSVGNGHAKRPMLPMIGVPTTAGTGSEAQSFAVIGDSRTRVKMALGDPQAAFRVALLDPELTVSMPAVVASATGIDAICHAVEAFVTASRNEFAQMYARRAWQLLVPNLPSVLADPGNVAARGQMLLGANFAGTAIEQSMLGATHALANPLSAEFGTRHGWAVGLMLPHVVRYNGEVVGPLYGRLAADVGVCEASDPLAAGRLAEYLADLFTEAGCPRRLAEAGVSAAVLPRLAAMAAEQWTGRFNPRPVDAASLEEIYRCAL